MEWNEPLYPSGNLLIKYHDKWRGAFYLKEDLTFTPDRNSGARFYLLKPGDTTIINGDRITINCGNKILVTNASHEVKLLDRNLIQRESTTFIITDGSDNTDPINYETPLYFICDKDHILKHEWSWSQSNDTEYKPDKNPKLVNIEYTNTLDDQVGFQLYLEKADHAITHKKAIKSNDLFDNYKGQIIITLLMVILILCILISK